jgi:beta-N-acetylhexosaminidase
LTAHEVIETFDISPAARSWRIRASAGYAVVRLEASPNSATGPTPWGPFAAAADRASDAAQTFAEQPQFEVTTESSPLPARTTAAVLVIGRDIHRHAFARAVVDQLRVDHAQVLVVDMGWPSDDRRYADVATHGSSRSIGAALLSFLAGADQGMEPSP